MVGKPNLPLKDAQQWNVRLQGASMTSEDLSDPLDQEREASMADEGGVAGAEMEAQPAFDPQSELNLGERKFNQAFRSTLSRVLIAGGVIGIGLALFNALRANRTPT